MEDFFKGTSLFGKAEIKELRTTINSLPIDRTTAKEKKAIKHKLFEMGSEYIDFRKAHVIVDLRDITNPGKLVFTCATHKAISEKMKEIFDETPYWRIENNLTGSKFELKERADETEIHLHKGFYCFTFNPDFITPSLFLRMLSQHGNDSEARNGKNILQFYMTRIKKSKGKI